ncbi:MAG TPA: EamA family transporter [Chthoniobacterales bacterium]
MLGLLPGFIGVAIIAWPSESPASAALPLPMMLLLLTSALSWALGTVYSQCRGAHIPSHDLAGMQLVGGGGVLLLLSVFVGELTGFSPQRVTMISIAGLLYLAVFGSLRPHRAVHGSPDKVPHKVRGCFELLI